jgi:hypothetical protein
MSKRQHEAKRASPLSSYMDWVPDELWPQILQHLLAKRGTELADTEWIFNWLATHRDAFRKMGPHLAVWLHTVFTSSWKFLVRYTKRRSHCATKRALLSQLASACTVPATTPREKAKIERMQRELVYVAFVAQCEDRLVYNCGDSYRTEGYCQKGHDVASNAHLNNTFFPYERRLHPMTSANAKQLVLGTDSLNQALETMSPALAFLCSRGMQHRALVPDTRRALTWCLQGEKARTTETTRQTHLADVVIQGVPLYAPYSDGMQQLRGLLHHHGAHNLSQDEMRAGLTLWSKQAARDRALWHRLVRLGSERDSKGSSSSSASSSSSSSQPSVNDDDISDSQIETDDEESGGGNDESSYSSSQLDDESTDSTTEFSSESSQDDGGTGDEDSAYWNGAPHGAVYDYDFSGSDES